MGATTKPCNMPIFINGNPYNICRIFSNFAQPQKLKINQKELEYIVALDERGTKKIFIITSPLHKRWQVRRNTVKFEENTCQNGTLAQFNMVNGCRRLGFVVEAINDANNALNAFDAVNAIKTHFKNGKFQALKPLEKCIQKILSTAFGKMLGKSDRGKGNILGKYACEITEERTLDAVQTLSKMISENLYDFEMLKFEFLSFLGKNKEALAVLENIGKVRGALVDEKFLDYFKTFFPSNVGVLKEYLEFLKKYLDSKNQGDLNKAMKIFRDNYALFRKAHSGYETWDKKMFEIVKKLFG